MRLSHSSELDLAGVQTARHSRHSAVKSRNMVAVGEPAVKIFVR